MAKDPRFEQRTRTAGSRRLLHGLWGLAILLAIGLAAHRLSHPPPPAGSLEATVESEAHAFLALEARENDAGNTAWVNAHLAFRHEDVLLSLWSALNDSVVPLGLLAEFNAGEIVAGTPGEPVSIGHGFLHSSSAPPTENWTPDAWKARLARWQMDGWNIVRLSVRQTRFQPPGTSQGARSTFALQVHLSNAITHTLGTLRGDLGIDWQRQPGTEVAPTPARIDASSLEWLTRSAGKAAFAEWFTEDFRSEPTMTLDPVLSGDLDGDGSTELLLVGAGQIIRRKGGRFEKTPLEGIPPSMTHAAALADLDGDGRLDLLVSGDGGLALLPGQAGPVPFGEARPLWHALDPADPDSLRPLKHAQVLTIADIDGDGDLDAFLGQYKVPYQKGQFPTPYYDAVDGFPSHLLRNDGNGQFTDVTAASGLATHASRRVYSASLVDIDSDGDADLVLVSDFSGLDLFLNDGRGHFTDVTDALGASRELFGMGHLVGDFDRDGKLDIWAIGMNSPTASVLESLGASRGAGDDRARHRAGMTAGNRMLLGDGKGRFRMAPWNSGLASGGWAWGASAFDADNDGRLDFYLANGHETFANPVDYERQFWLHDIYVGSSSNSAVADVYFRSALGRRKAGQQSYGGWQDNPLFLASSPEHFAEVGFLAGVGHPEDCRNVLAEDLDGDGRVDLIVTSYEQWPKPRQRLFIHRNEMQETGHWIGFRLPPRGLNARVEIRTSEGTQTCWLATGDSFRSQHSFNAHFGLGASARLIGATVTWPDGTQKDLGQPALDQWHRIP